MPITDRNNEDRVLTPDETAVLTWLLQNGEASAKPAVSQVDRLRVSSRCQCGCCSIDFSVDGAVPPANSGMEVVSDFWWRTSRGNLCGVFAFLRNGMLAGMDFWSIDGQETPSELPQITDLRPMSHRHDAET